MKPSIGDPVIYRTSESGEDWPAIVTVAKGEQSTGRYPVESDTHVHLMVFMAAGVTPVRNVPMNDDGYDTPRAHTWRYSTVVRDLVDAEA